MHPAQTPTPKTEETKKIFYLDDDKYPVKTLVSHRAPSVLVGLVLGIALSFITSQFEDVLRYDVRIAFFIPFIVYMADAIGAQTENIYTRDLKTGRAVFKTYLVKEAFVGLAFASIASLVIGLVTHFWIRDMQITLAVSLSMFLAITIAPLVALIITELFQLKHSDPAVGAGPIATVFQDSLSIMIYGIVSSMIIL